jgi:hypothetical protein
VIDRGEATSSLADYVSRVADMPLVVTENGKPVAILVAADAADLETLALSNNPDFWDIIEQAREQDKREGTLSLAEVYRLFEEDTVQVCEDKSPYETGGDDSPGEDDRSSKTA